MSRVFQGRVCAADVSNRIGIASEIAETLAIFECIDDVIAEARVIRDRERPHIGLTFVQSAAFRVAFESGDRTGDRVHSFVIRNCSFESQIVK